MLGSRPLRRWCGGNPSPTRDSRRFRPTLEGLESRWNPANVTASVVNGVLTLTANAGAFDDAIEIEEGSDPGKLDLTGTGTTINGQANLTVKGVRSIVCQMKGGNDLLTFNFAAIAGSITFNGGGGTNELAIGTNTKIGGAVQYLNGSPLANDDRLSISGFDIVIGRGVFADYGEGVSYTTLDATIGGRVAITGGSGADKIFTNNLIVARSLTASLGDGANFVGIEAVNDGISQVAAPTFIGGALYVATGNGEDVIEIGQEDIVTILGRSTFLTGGETLGGDTVKFDNSDFYSTVLIDLGGGDDYALIETVDNVSAYADFHNDLTVFGRGGDDSVAFGQASGTRRANLALPPTLDGGGGNDVLALINLEVNGVVVDTLPQLGSTPLNFETILI